MTPEEDQVARDLRAGQIDIAEELQRQQIIEFQGARLNWRLQRAFEESFPGRAFQQPRPARPRPVAAKPQGFA